MKKNIVRFITLLFITFCIACPNVQAVQNDVGKTTSSVKNAETSAITPKPKTEKRNELSGVLSKFALTLAWVSGSCVVIFLLLYAYKKLKKTSIVNPKQIDTEKNLNSPDTIEDATRFFIEKF